jgi:hypothetical protein
MDREPVRTGDSFTIRLDAEKYAYVKYHISGNAPYIDSTFVPEEYRGQGLAETLVKAVLNYAAEKKLKIVPNCSYAKRYIEKHPEYQNLL